MDYAKSYGLNFNVTIRPIDAMRISISPRFSSRVNDLQYIADLDLGDESRYILGTVSQRTYSASIRLNYNITPDLTLEFWGQPFIATGLYSEIKRVREPNSESYLNRFSQFTEEELSFDTEDNVFRVSETSRNDTYEFDNPDFNVVEFRSNFVVRWEYIPGSVLFLVWSNNGSVFDQDRDNGFNRLSSRFSDLEATNTFLIKYTYRFIL